MKVNIYGLSEATIAFNSLGITLRGNDPNDLGSVARGLDVNDEAQVNEIREIERAGLIRIEEIGVQVETSEDTEKEVEVAPKTSRRRGVLEKEVDRIHAEEDGAILEIEKPVKKKATKKKAEKPAKKTEEPTNAEDDSKVVVMTATGPKSGNMVHKMVPEISEEDEKCKASMEAAKKLDEEDNASLDVVDESQLDPSERMGGKAVIGTGSGETETSKMQSSIFGDLPEPNFIDDKEDPFSDDAEEVTEEVIEEVIEDPFSDDTEEVTEITKDSEAFVDAEGDVEGEGELGDAFIEI